MKLFPSFASGLAEGGGCGLRFRRSPPMGRRELHVEEQRRSTPPGVRLALAHLDVLAPLLAVLAADRERKSAQTLFADFLAALEAVAVIALLEPDDRVVNLVEGLRLHLNKGELQIFLDVGLGALDGIKHFVELAAPRALFADTAHLALNLRV